MALTRSAIGWHVGSMAAGGIAVFSAMATQQVDVYAIWNAMNKIVADVTTLLAALAPLAAIFGAAYRTWNAKQVPAAALVVDTGSTSKAETDAEHPPGNTATVATINGTTAGKIVGALLIGLMLIAGADNAHAQQRPIAILKPAAPTDLMSKLEAVKKEVVDGVIVDITAALADASTIDADTNKPRDQIAAACYPEQIKFLQTLPVAQPFQGKFILVQLFQRKRDFVIQLQKGLPVSLKIGCGALLGDEVNILIKTLGMVGVAVAAPGLTPLLPAAGVLPALPIGGLL